MSEIGRKSTTITRPELLRDGTDVEFRQTVSSLLAFSTRLEAVRQQFGAYIGLTGVQYTILISIAHMQGGNGIGVNAIARHLSLSGAFVTNEVGKLIKLGLATKRPNPEDRRRILLRVTQKSDALLASLIPVQQEVNDVLFGPLTAQDFDRLRVLAPQLAESTGKALALAHYLTGNTESTK